MHTLCPLTLAAAVTFVTVAGAQEARLNVRIPARVVELQPSLDVDVTGADIDDLPLTVKVYVDSVDITSLVSISVAFEDREDVDSDGILESYDGRHRVSFGSYDLVPGELLMVEVSASAPEGAIVRQDASPVTSHLTVSVDDELAANDEAVHVAVYTSQLAVSSQSLSVYLNEVDVTSQVSITGPELAYEDVGSGSPPFVRTRVQRYWVDISGLGNVSGWMRFTAEATNSAAEATSASNTSSVSIAGGEPDPCQVAALNDFADAIGASKDTSGNVSISSDGPTVKAAADALQQALEECELNGSPPLPRRAVTITTSSGLEMKIAVKKDGNDAEASGKEDLVVAIGGDGSGSADGGDAKADNTKAGGAAVAVGGDGGSATSSGGNGGNGTASAQPPGSALGAGGNGGVPGNPENAGGNGGKGAAWVPKGGSGGQSLGSQGEPGTPGTHGLGGWFSQSPSGSSGQTPAPEPNS